MRRLNPRISCLLATSSTQQKRAFFNSKDTEKLKRQMEEAKKKMQETMSKTAENMKESSQKLNEAKQKAKGYIPEGNLTFLQKMMRKVSPMFTGFFWKIFVQNTREKILRFMGKTREDASKKGYFQTFRDNLKSHYEKNTRGTYSFTNPFTK